MTNPISKYFDYAQLAQASYAWFFSGGSRKEELTNESQGSFTDTQADIFLEGYSLLDYQPNTLEGFSASLFQDNETGEHILSIRGTETGLAGIITDAGRAEKAKAPASSEREDQIGFGF